MSQFTEITSQEGLRATTINIPTTDQYSIQCTLTTPSAQSAQVSSGPGGGTGTGTGGVPKVPSQVVMTVKQNGSTVYTSNPGDQGLVINALNCTAADVITITTSSSLASDQVLNAVKMTVAVSEGPI
jgi:hypothetical protein